MSGPRFSFTDRKEIRTLPSEKPAGMIIYRRDFLDIWRVEALIPNQLLRLRAEMKVPGQAWLEFEIITQGESEVHITQTAYFIPAGLPGLLYWYTLYPIHVVIFQGMISVIANKAESLSHSSVETPA